MNYINIEQVKNGKVKANANIGGEAYAAEFSDMMMAVVWAEEILEKEDG